MPATDISTSLDLPPDVMLMAMPIDGVRGAMEQLLRANENLTHAVRGMSDKRRAEFVAGRLCAARALSRSGVPAEFPLRADGRLPIWPPGVLGSISHCASMAAAMTATANRYCALGVDVEHLIDPGVAEAIQPEICRRDELEGLEKHTPCQAEAVTLLFSAKEALYKALFPQTGCFKDFHSAELHACGTRSLILKLTCDWTPRWPAGMPVQVNYAWVGQVLVSAVCIPLQ